MKFSQPQRISQVGPFKESSSLRIMERRTAVGIGRGYWRESTKCRYIRTVLQGSSRSASCHQATCSRDAARRQTRSPAHSRAPRSQPHSLAHGLRNRHAVSHLAPSRYTPTPMPHPLDMHIDMYVYTYM